MHCPSNRSVAGVHDKFWNRMQPGTWEGAYHETSLLCSTNQVGNHISEIETFYTLSAGCERGKFGSGCANWCSQTDGCGQCAYGNPSKCIYCAKNRTFNNEYKTCTQCYHHCENCIGSGANQCFGKSSVENYSIVNYNSPFGQFEQCHPGCTKCFDKLGNGNSDESCMSCAPNLYMYNWKCLACHSTCGGACTGPKYYQCLTCPENKFFNVINSSETSGFCIVCHETCGEQGCIGASSSDCLGCPPARGLKVLDYAKKNGYCVLCNSECGGTCCGSGTSECLSCQADKWLVVKNQIDRSGVCVRCYSDCGGRCVGPGADHCLDCAVGKKLRVYDEVFGESGVCEIFCDEVCKTCSGTEGDECLTCEFGSKGFC